MATSHSISHDASAIYLLSRRWTLPVLSELGQGGRRYQDLYDALDGISYKVLTETLRRAERDGLIARHLDANRSHWFGWPPSLA
jgi:DNA-binding HxlR family transcriptional regulator